MENNYIESISSITNIPIYLLNKIFDINLLEISNEIINNKIEEDKWEVNLANYGILRITLNNENLIYKFLPNEKFNDIVRETIKTNKSLLINTIEDKLVKAIENNFKDMLE